MKFNYLNQVWHNKSERLSLLKWMIIFMVAVFTLVNPAVAQKKIYVTTDLEGISGVFKFAQTREKDTPLNIQACEFFMGDVAAVIHGLRDGGATEIIIQDGHGTQAVLPQLMDPGATYITGNPKPGPGNLYGGVLNAFLELRSSFNMHDYLNELQFKRLSTVIFRRFRAVERF
jgi:hypothetical protein